MNTLVNVGTVDRVLRVIAGIVLIASPLGLYGPEMTTPWGWIGLVPLATGVVGFCPIYRLVGVNTCARET